MLVRGVRHGNIRLWTGAGQTPSSGRGALTDFNQRLVIDNNGSWTQSVWRRHTAVTFNESGNDVDFRVESDTSTHMLFVDAGNSHVNIGTTADYGGVLNVFTAGNDVALALASDNGNALVGPVLKLTRMSGSPADGDLAGEINFSAKNSAAETSLAKITARQDDVSNGTEDSTLTFSVRRAGGTDNAMELGSATVFNNDGADRDFRVESDANANALFVNAGTSEVFMGISVQADTGARLHVSVAGSVGIEVSDDDTSGFYGLWFARAGVQKGYTQTTGSGTTYNTTSDARLKENVSTITDGIDVLNQMRAVEFDWIGEDDEPRTRGFIAQEMVGVAPESVSGEPDGEIMMGMDYGRITPVIVAALQEAITKIETLEARITALENA